MHATTDSAQALVNKLQSYGVRCDGEVVTEEYHRGVSYDDLMTLGELVRAGGKVTRVRILQEMGRCDISYIYGTVSGKTVPLRLDIPAGSTCLWRRELKGAFIEWAKQEGVYAKGCGLLDEGNWSVLR